MKGDEEVKAKVAMWIALADLFRELANLTSTARAVLQDEARKK